VKSIGENLSTAGEAIQGTMGVIGDGLKVTGAAIQGAAGMVLDTVSSAGSATLDALKGTANIVGDGIAAAGEALGNGIDDGVAFLRENAGVPGEIAGNMIETVAGAVATGTDAVVGAGQAAGTMIADAAGAVWGVVGDAGSTAGGMIADGAGAVTGAMGDTGGYVLNLAAQGGEGAARIAVAGFDATTQGIGAASHAVAAAGGVVVNDIRSLPGAVAMLRTAPRYQTALYARNDTVRISALTLALHDRYGSPLRHTEVVLFSEPKIAMTDGEGFATFQDVPLGNHTLEIHVPEQGVETRQINLEPQNLPKVEKKAVAVSLPVIEISVTGVLHGSAPAMWGIPWYGWLVIGGLCGICFSLGGYIIFSKTQRRSSTCGSRK